MSECRRRISIAVLGLVSLAAVSGCGGGSPTTTVSGTVTLNGKPLPGDATASIAFSPAKTGVAGVAAPITEGRYSCPGVPTGDVKVSFDITQPDGPPRKSDRTGEMYQEVKNLVPASFAGGIPLTIQASATHDFNLTD